MREIVMTLREAVNIAADEDDVLQRALEAVETPPKQPAGLDDVAYTAWLDQVYEPWRLEMLSRYGDRKVAIWWPEHVSFHQEITDDHSVAMLQS